MKSPTAGTLPQCDDASPTDQWLQDLVNDCEEQMGTGSWLPWLRSRLGFDLSPKWQDLPESDEPEVVTCPLLAPCPLLEVGQEDAQECSFLLQGKVGPDGERPRCALVTLDLQRGSSLRRVQDVVGESSQSCPYCQEQLETHCASFLRAGQRLVLFFKDQDVSRLKCVECKSKWYLPREALSSIPVSAFFALLWSGLRALPCDHSFSNAHWELWNAIFSMRPAPAVALELRGPAFVWVETMRRSSVAPELLRTVARVEKMIEAHLAKVFKEFRALGPMGTLQRKAWFWGQEDETIRCALRSRNLLEASALLRKCSAQLQVFLDDTSRLVNLGCACLLHSCLAKCRKLVEGEIVEEEDEEEQDTLPLSLSAQSSPSLLKDLQMEPGKAFLQVPNRRRTVAVSSRQTSKPQRSPSAPPLRRKPEEEEEKDRDKYGRKSLDDSSLSLLGLAAWADPFAVLRRLYPGQQGDPRQGTRGYNDFAKAKLPEPISVSASNEEKWTAACQEPRTILEAAGYKEPYELDVECGAAGVAVPLPAKGFDAGALIAHALLSKSCWNDMQGRLQGVCLGSYDDHCFRSLTGEPQSWNSFEFSSLPAVDAPIKVEVRSPNGGLWSVTIHQPVRFHLLRHLAFSDDAVLCELIRHCCAHDTSGGKSKSSFWRSEAGELVLKEVRPAEGEHLATVLAAPMVERMAQAQSGEPSLLCEIFGYFEVRGHGRQSHESHSIIVMRNLLQITDGWQIFDIKGVGAHRNLPPAKEESEEAKAKVQWDGGFLAAFSGFPVVLSKEDSDRLEHALTKDLELLQELGLVDYSLLMAYEEGEIGKSGRIRLGIIDFLQPYTLDKKLESTVKKLVQRHEPTIVAPDQYARRLYEFAHAAFQAAPKDD